MLSPPGSPGVFSLAPRFRRCGSTLLDRTVLAALVMLLAASFPTMAAAQSAPAQRFRSHARLSQAIDSLRAARPQLVQVSEIARSPGGRAVQAMRVAAGANADRRPALLVIANAYGPHTVGSEIALAAARRLVTGYGTDSAVTRLLDRHAVWFIPRANPDAAEALFEQPLAERTRNATRYDDDRDGDADEDGPDDLNGDGVITMMRIADLSGEWMADPIDPALMRRADATKGEAGRFQLYVEGRDDDKDDRFNEDPPGGADVARNFSYNYEWFGEGSGLHQYSAPEARAIAQFIVDHPNVAAVYVLGPQDNLVTPWTFRAATGIGGNPTGTSAGGPLQSILREDESWFAEVSKRYKRTTGIAKGPASMDTKGDPLSFSYYDMGRLAFGGRAWSVPDVPADTAKNAPKPETPDALADDRNALKWLRANAPGGFVEWTPVRHPDFPGRTVEVGGFRPYARLNPPPTLLDSVLAKQSRFIAELAGMLPSVAVREVEVRQLGDRVYRVTAQIANTGYLPSSAQIGARVRWPLRVKVELKTGNGQSISGGRAVQMLDPIPGSGRSREVSWVVVGAPGSTVTLRASSPVAGDASETITLRGGR